MDKIKETEGKMKFVVSKQNKNSNLVIVVLVASIAGILGGCITSVVLKGDNAVAQTVDGITKKYEIEKVSNPVVGIAEKVSPSVVGIKVTYTYEVFKGLSTETEGEGSGIIYSKDGYIVTNYHVIESAINDSTSKIEVILCGSEEWIAATIVGYDKVTDLAVIKVEKEGLVPAEFDSNDSIKVGEIAVAIGNPLGQTFAGSVTSGIVSAVNRSITTDGRTYRLLQTDAAINTGNSGGALANSEGKVIGINTVKIVATGVEGIGFAIPSSEALPIITELIQNKKIMRPYLGITGINVTESMAKAYDLTLGVYVQSIIENSPATLAGFKQGDIIIEAEGKKITTMNELNQLKYTYKIGDKFKVKVVRGKEQVELTVTLGEE